MLAAEDAHNPPALLPLSRFSLELYPGFLERIQQASGFPVPYQTSVTYQHLENGEVVRLDEHSLDPRQLSLALLAAVRSTSIDLREDVGELEIADDDDLVYVRDTYGDELSAPRLVHATGAWFRTPAGSEPMVTPRKGQMLRVAFEGSEVHRSEHIYVVPRTFGENAGTALIGATVEEAGFDLTTRPEDLARLHALAAKLLPAIAGAEHLESWAGLRPATPDQLPLLGALPYSPREFAATGHFRNGILLAPATAHLMADLLESKATPLITPFSPSRFTS